MANYIVMIKVQRHQFSMPATDWRPASCRNDPLAAPREEGKQLR
jgi:hypothetical protein